MEYKDQLAITVPAASTGAFERQNDDIKPISENDDNISQYKTLWVNMDGKIVSGNRVTPTIGEHELSVRIFTKDKGVEDISRIFVVTPKN